MKTRWMLTAVVVGAMAVLAFSSTGAGAATSVTIGLKSFSITRSTSTVKHGKVTFHVTNHAKIAHNFHIRKGTSGAVLPAHTKNLAGGTSQTVTASLSKGTYTVYCSIHPTLMHFVLKVT
jgi:plastocyanin